jgi:hypothetical protein
MLSQNLRVLLLSILMLGLGILMDRVFLQDQQKQSSPQVLETKSNETAMLLADNNETPKLRTVSLDGECNTSSLMRLN